MTRQLRHALRGLIRRPGFTLLVLITLGIGIGASTAIFTVVNAVLLRPLPYEDPERLVFIWNRLGETGVDKAAVAGPDFVDYVEQTRLFEGFTAFVTLPEPLSEEGMKPVSINAAWASPNFFSLLGVELILGEMYGPEVEGLLHPRDLRDPDLVLPQVPAIISHGLWQQRYGGDPGVLGRRIRVAGQPMIITGVAPPGFRLFQPVDAAIPERIDLWSPFAYQLRASERSTQWIHVFARLKSGVSLSDAQAEMDRLAAWQREHFEFHRSAGMEIRVIPIHEDVTGHVRPYLVWFVVAAGLLLVLTFSNVANLLLLRSWRRRREVSIRAAMGGRPRRLVAQVLGESTLLALLGGAVGLLLAHWTIRLLLALQPQNLPRVTEASVDPWVLAVTLGTALLAALACGLVPAFQASRINLAATLSERSATGNPAHHWLRKGLVVAEIVISLILLISTGLILRTFTELSRIDPGFEPRNVLTTRITLPAFQYAQPAMRPLFFADLARQARAMPGVESVGAAIPIPLEETQSWWGPWSVAGMNHEEWTKNEAAYRVVMPGYFETMGMRRLKGRFFNEADNRAGARPVTIVDEVFARRAWPGEEPVGKQLMVWQWDDTGTGMVQLWTEVVGLIAHVRDGDLTQDGIGTIYGPHHLYPLPRITLVLKSATSDPLALVEPLRDVVRSMDPDLPLVNVHVMQDYVDDFLAPTRFALTLMGFFALIAVVLATVGLYGVVSSGVEQRAQEIGIRMAFGAGRGRVLRLVLRQALVLALWGLALGLIAAFFLTRGLAGMLYGVTATDPVTFAALGLVQMIVALLASLLPAWRATRVDPVAVLNTE